MGPTLRSTGMGPRVGSRVSMCMWAVLSTPPTYPRTFPLPLLSPSHLSSFPLPSSSLALSFHPSSPALHSIYLVVHSVYTLPVPGRGLSRDEPQLLWTLQGRKDKDTSSCPVL